MPIGLKEINTETSNIEEAVEIHNSNMRRLDEIDLPEDISVNCGEFGEGFPTDPKKILDFGEF